jgi:hypothetical protein
VDAINRRMGFASSQREVELEDRKQFTRIDVDLEKAALPQKSFVMAAMLR